MRNLKKIRRERNSFFFIKKIFNERGRLTFNASQSENTLFREYPDGQQTNEKRAEQQIALLPYRQNDLRVPSLCFRSWDK